MSTAAIRPMSAEEFYLFVHRAENRDRRFELERGEVVEMSRPGKLHGLICALIVGVLLDYSRKRKRGYPCSNDTGLIVEQDPDTERGPDVLFFDDAESIDDVVSTFGTTPPLLAVEVLSPNDTHGRIMRRVQDQIAFGTPLIWVVDPEAHNVTIFRPGEAVQVLEESDEITGEEVLPEFRCKVAEFFRLPGR